MAQNIEHDENNMPIYESKGPPNNLHEKSKTALIHVWGVVNHLTSMANTHGAEFISDNHWKLFVPIDAQSDLRKMSEEDLVQLPLIYDFNGDVHRDTTSIDNVKITSQWLKNFLDSLHSCHLDQLDILTPCSEVLPDVNSSSYLVSEAMSEKKSHEVKIMSEMVARIYKQVEADIVVDIGSGKGYLSSELSHHHKLPVLGLDSQQSNTHGASIRDRRLEKKWNALERKIKQTKSDTYPRSTISFSDNKFHTMNEYKTSSDKEQEFSAEKCSKNGSSLFNPSTTEEQFSQNSKHSRLDKQNVRLISDINFSSDVISLHAQKNPVLNAKNNLLGENCTKNNSFEENKTQSLDENKYSQNSRLKYASKNSESDTNSICSLSFKSKSVNLSSSKFSSPLKTDESCPKKNEKDPSSKELLYLPLTVEVTSDIDFNSLIKCHPSCIDTERNYRTVVAGLHTCGGLAVSTIRLFLSCPNSKALVCVGCCYQLMNENFNIVPIIQESVKASSEKSKQLTAKDHQNRDVLISSNLSLEEPTNQSELNCSCEPKKNYYSSFDFPLSSVGKELGLNLGRNARNLASQSIHRMVQAGLLQGEDFYWRALLDTLLKSRNISVPEKIIGLRGLKKRCKTFDEYVKKALKKLDINPSSVDLTDLSEIEERYSEHRQNLTAFFQLKLAIAPAIESLILLDRYLFVLEQKNVKQSWLVQLFDPLTSPRCYAIIAHKQL